MLKNTYTSLPLENPLYTVRGKVYPLLPSAVTLGGCESLPLRTTVVTLLNSSSHSLCNCRMNGKFYLRRIMKLPKRRGVKPVVEAAVCPAFHYQLFTTAFGRDYRVAMLFPVWCIPDCEKGLVEMDVLYSAVL